MEMGLNTYTNIFPEVYKLLNTLLTLPVGTATVEHSFSQMKLVKTRAQSKVSDSKLASLICIATEGSEHCSVPFNEIIDIFKNKTLNSVVMLI